MNGKFEVDRNNYPYGYLGVGLEGKFLVTNMISLSAVSQQAIRGVDAESICARANKRLRSGISSGVVEAGIIEEVQATVAAGADPHDAG